MYFITTINKDDSRCVGYYSSKETAIKVVVDNTCDLYEEGCYPYAVIENVSEGLYQYDFTPLWFTYNETTKKYEMSAPPLFIRKKGTVGYGIG